MTLPVVVLAGGLGTRVRSLTGDERPKALLDVAGRPFIDRKLEELVENGVEEVVLLVGHGGAMLSEHVGDGSRFGVRARCVHEPSPLGTGGAVRSALDALPETFWVTYGDSFLFAPMRDIERRFLDERSGALMTVLLNDDRWGPSNVTVRGGLVVAYEKRPLPGRHRYIDYGLLLFRRSVFEPCPLGERFDLDLVLQRLIGDRDLLAHEVGQRFYDIGSPEAHAETVRRFSRAAPRAGLEHEADTRP